MFWFCLGGFLAKFDQLDPNKFSLDDSVFSSVKRTGPNWVVQLVGLGNGY